MRLLSLGVLSLWFGALLAPAVAADYPVRFIGSQGNFIYYDDSYDNVLIAWGDVGPEDPRTVFTLIDENGCTLEDGDTIFLKASNGNFVSAEPGGAPYANSASQGENERFTVEDIGGYGIWRGGGLIKIRQAGGSLLPVHDRGALFFDAEPYAPEERIILSNVETPWAGPRFTLRGYPATTASSGMTALVSVADIAEGPPDGTLKYSFSVSKRGGGVIAEQPLGPGRGMTIQGRLLEPGHYRIQARVERYCGDEFVSRSEREIFDYEVCGVEITSPVVGMSANPNQATRIEWSRTSSCTDKPIKVERWASGRLVEELGTVALNQNRFDWAVPPGIEASAASTIILRNANQADRGNFYRSNTFVIPSGNGTPDFAVLAITPHPSLCYPSENWVEVTVASTAQRKVELSVEVLNQLTQQTSTKRRVFSLLPGISKLRVTMDFSGAGPRKITAAIDKPENPAEETAETNETNNVRELYIETVRSCS